MVPEGKQRPVELAAVLKGMILTVQFPTTDYI
jgi:hypothetical protein